MLGWRAPLTEHAGGWPTSRALRRAAIPASMEVPVDTTVPTHRFIVTLRWADGEERVTHVNATSVEDARQWLLDFAAAQMADPRWGGDRSKGMPTVVAVVRDGWNRPR